MRDLWSSLLPSDGSSARIEVLSWLSRAALDIIGLAGFGYQFNALSDTDKPNELNKAFDTLFRAHTEITPMLMLQIFVPISRKLV